MIFYKVLPDDYYYHVLIYITFIRLLTMNKINKNDIVSSQNLINHFCKRFKCLYGLEHLTYKLHTHLHLPAQVVNFGPLHEVSAFPFESK